MAGLDEGQVPQKPRRALDTTLREGFADLVENGRRLFIKSRDFSMDQHVMQVNPKDVQVVLFDVHSLDSFAGCCAARAALGDDAHYEGVTRSGFIGDLNVDLTGKVVAMLGVCWSVESMLELAWECERVIVIDTHTSVERQTKDFRNNYSKVVVVVDKEMGAGVMAWNYFHPSENVPLVLRAVEELELGRYAFQHAQAFVAGACSSLSFAIPRGHVTYGDASFHSFDKLLRDNDSTRDRIKQAIVEGGDFLDGIVRHCQAAKQRSTVQSFRKFPAWKAAVVHLCSPYESQVAEYLSADLANSCGGSEKRCFGVVFEVRGHRVRVTLRSEKGGVDVSEIAEDFDGGGTPTRAFFMTSVDIWEGLWEQPEIMLRDVETASGACLEVKRGDRISVAVRGERFAESPFDEWSWGYKVDEPEQEGWIPTLAHTLLVAVGSQPSPGPGVKPVEQGDLIVGLRAMGAHFYGYKMRPGPGTSARGPLAWFPYNEVLLQRVQPSSVAELLADAD